jgi:aldehyde:ferredoxin oxidoreductase
VREYREKWSRSMDVPPARWFKEPLTEGALKGATLDLEKYNGMLNAYYVKRGWDKRGIPKLSTLQRLGLTEEAKQLGMYVRLAEENPPVINTPVQNTPFP